MKLARNLKPISLFALVFALALTLAQSFGGAMAAPVTSSASAATGVQLASAADKTSDKPSQPVAPLSGLQVAKHNPDVSGVSYTILTNTGGMPVSATHGIGLHADDAVQQIAFPFPVTFYGTQYTTATVSTNGNLQFNSASTEYSNTCLPTSNFADAIAVYWDDLDTNGPGQDIYTDTIGTAPNRTFIIEWRAEEHSNGMIADAELVLYENNSGIIRVYYGDAATIGASATAGVQEGNGMNGNSYSEYSCNGNRGLLFNTLIVSYVPVQGPTPTPGGATPTPMATNTPPAPTVTPTDCPNVFVDLNGNVFYGAIHYLNCRGVVNGTDATHYGPAGTSTRAQFAKVVVLGFGLTPVTPQQQDFSDVPPTYYAYTYIETGYHDAILSGFDMNTCQQNGQTYPCYLPNRPITRGQLTKLVVGAAQYQYYTPTSGPDFTDVPASNIFYVSIETAYHKGVVGGYSDHTFRPNNNIRRDEMAQIVFKGVTTPLPAAEGRM